MRQALLFFSILICGTLGAQWDLDPSVNTSVTIANKSQDNIHAATDANGGAIISWDDNRNSSTNSSDIYAQRLNKSGVIKWAAGGIAVCSSSATQRSSAITEAGQGNAIIVWEDYRSGNYDIYAQKIDSLGNILWANNGIAVCSKLTHQKSPKVISDNAGGAIIVWEDSVNNYWDIYAQRVSTSGSIMWAVDGSTICSSTNAQLNPRLEKDGSGGAIIVWQDKRNNADHDIYAQRVDNNGAVQWTPNGVAVCVTVNTQSNPRIEPDGSGGAIIGWIDKRNALDNNIYGQRINAVGTVQWAANGVLVCGATGNQSALDIKYIGTTGTVFSWKDSRTTTTSVYAQLISLTGTNLLSADGALISNGLKSNNPNVVSDDQNGCIIAWQDSSVTGWDIKTQRLDPSGNILWTNGGVVVSNAINDQINVNQIGNNSGGAIYFWEDHRNGADYNIYAHHLYETGSPDVSINELELRNMTTSCFPNPISINSVIKLNGYFSAKTWQLTIYDDHGKQMITKELRVDQSFELDKNVYTSGVYFYNINVGKKVLSGKFVSFN